MLGTSVAPPPHPRSNALRQALAAGDELVVGLIGDEEVLRNKGSLPVMPFEERLVALQACKFVHEVIWWVRAPNRWSHAPPYTRACAHTRSHTAHAATWNCTLQPINPPTRVRLVLDFSIECVVTRSVSFLPARWCLWCFRVRLP